MSSTSWVSFEASCQARRAETTPISLRNSGRNILRPNLQACSKP